MRTSAAFLLVVESLGIFPKITGRAADRIGGGGPTQAPP
jgi:hypothetical protein